MNKYVVGLLALFLTACGGGGSTPEPVSVETTQSTKPPTTPTPPAATTSTCTNPYRHVEFPSEYIYRITCTLRDTTTTKC